MAPASFFPRRAGLSSACWLRANSPRFYQLPALKNSRVVPDYEGRSWTKT